MIAAARAGRRSPRWGPLERQHRPMRGVYITDHSIRRMLWLWAKERGYPSIPSPPGWLREAGPMSSGLQCSSAQDSGHGATGNSSDSLRLWRPRQGRPSERYCQNDLQLEGQRPRLEWHSAIFRTVEAAQPKTGSQKEGRIMNSRKRELLLYTAFIFLVDDRPWDRIFRWMALLTLVGLLVLEIVRRFSRARR